MNAPAPTPLHTELDDESLLAALTLAPGVYSRNRMFTLYETHGRAKQLRAAAYRLRGIASTWFERTDASIRCTPNGSGFDLVLDVPSMAYRRTLRISEFERGLLAMLLGRADPGGRPPEPLLPADKRRIESALARLTVA